MTNLTSLLNNLTIKASLYVEDKPITSVCFDSRKVEKGSMFVAIAGTQSNGHEYIDQATRSGATAIVCEQLPQLLFPDVSYIVVPNSHSALALIAANFYGNPSEKLTLVGVTGTNGKTTIATLLYQLFRKAGQKAGLLSTVAVYVDDQRFEATHTTPDPLQLHHYLHLMVQQGVKYCFMEVSSHGIDQHRTEGLHFAGGIFTNLTRDHLDYHKTFAAYRDVKKRFFDALPSTAFALVNIDDKNGAFMLQNTKAQKKTYALKTHANYKAHIIESRFDGLLLRINQHEVWTKLIGEFNAYNLLAVFGAATLLGVDELEALTLISAIEPVAGRFQYAVSATGVITIVDYAHTPDALENVLKTINDIRTHNETLTTVVGCGGNRDKGKRPIMADIATTLSDNVILTSDNPRNEEPEAILSEMEQGVQAQHFHKVQTITDRRQAIQSVCKNAQKGDIILIAGKGHETYQEIKGVRHHFDDFEIVREYLELYKK